MAERKNLYPMSSKDSDDSKGSTLHQLLLIAATLTPLSIGSYWLKHKLNRAGAPPPPPTAPVPTPPLRQAESISTPSEPRREISDEQWLSHDLGNRRRIVNGQRMRKNNWGEWQEED